MTTTAMHLHVLSRLLRHADSVLKSAYLAFAFTLLAWLLGSGESKVCYVLVVLSLLLMAAQHYVAIRVMFDADLLAQLARMIDSGTSERGALQALDQSLLHFGLMPEAKLGRDWQLRFRGCLRLFKCQVALLVAQYGVMMAALLLCTMRPL
ncbi:hypothetical protein [Diaphorobacter aerolatus]|uniref:Uncharacterized protein n=1 Tax=Diaphorobacter aerolatus TaxID=1288495 RepID=A0A7H0GPC3_9BURK|nr:hypothetical protein [Diaphorobacter aerolatus]QNP50139.1 hypothetical protein H9K75_10100 [Diaphorobacter aerolatus]